MKLYYLAIKDIEGEQYEYAHTHDITEEEFEVEAEKAFRSARKAKKKIGRQTNNL